MVPGGRGQGVLGVDLHVLDSPIADDSQIAPAGADIEIGGLCTQSCGGRSRVVRAVGAGLDLDGCGGSRVGQAHFGDGVALAEIVDEGVGVGNSDFVANATVVAAEGGGRGCGLDAGVFVVDRGGAGGGDGGDADGGLSPGCGDGDAEGAAVDPLAVVCGAGRRGEAEEVGGDAVGLVGRGIEADGLGI